MRRGIGPGVWMGACIVLVLAAAARAAPTKYYYVGGPQPPGTSGDDSWRWRAAGIQAAYDDIRATGSGDWVIRVHASYSEDAGSGQIVLQDYNPPAGRDILGVYGGMTWDVGAPGVGPVNVVQDLAHKTTVGGDHPDGVFLVHNDVLRLDGFDVSGGVRFRNNALGSTLVNCHVSGDGSGVGVYVGDNCNKVYVLNTLVEGFETGVHYQDTVSGRSVFLVHATVADNAVGITNLASPWSGWIQSFNTVIAADSDPVAQTANLRYYSSTDVFDGDGSFAFDGVHDIDVGGSLLSDPLLEADYSLGTASPCLDAGGLVDAGGFFYVDVDPAVGFQADADVVVAGTPPPGAVYVLLTDLMGAPRVEGAGADLGALEGGAASTLIPEPSAALLALAASGLLLRRRTGRE